MHALKQMTNTCILSVTDKDIFLIYLITDLADLSMVTCILKEILFKVFILFTMISVKYLSVLGSIR